MIPGAAFSFPNYITLIQLSIHIWYKVRSLKLLLEKLAITLNT